MNHTIHSSADCRHTSPIDGRTTALYYPSEKNVTFRQPTPHHLPAPIIRSFKSLIRPPVGRPPKFRGRQMKRGGPHMKRGGPLVKRGGRPMKRGGRHTKRGG